MLMRGILLAGLARGGSAFHLGRERHL